MAANAAYDFSAAPTAVPIKRNAATTAKYRDEQVSINGTRTREHAKG